MKLQDLLEEIKKPNSKQRKRHKETHPDGGKLHYVVVSEKGKTLGFIDDKFVKKTKADSPKKAAHIRLRQVEYYKAHTNKKVKKND